MYIDPERLKEEVIPKFTATKKYFRAIIDAVGTLKYPTDMNEAHKKYIMQIPQKIRDINSSFSRGK